MIGTVQYARREVASQPVRLAPRPVFLAGREDLLRDLDDRLTAEGSQPRLVVLCGLGGAGKTSVAVEYAYRHVAGLSVAWQFPAEEPAALAAGFSDLAAVLGAGDLLSGAGPVAAVHGALAAHPGQWLLLFDNVTSPADVAAVLPPAGRGRVLVTTQDAGWPGAHVLDVPVLDPDTAAGFLASRTGQAGQETAARELAVALGGLPLALEQAAAYMRSTGLAMAGYLGLFRDRSADLLARGDPAGYDKRVTTTWSLAFSQVEQDAPRAAGLLRLLACCAPEAVPLGLLLQPCPNLAGSLSPEVLPLLVPLLEDPLAVSDAVAALRRYSLISAPQDSAVSVHRLVQAVTLAQLTTEAAEAWREAATALIEAALPEREELPETWPAYAALLPHAQAALPAYSDGMGQIASYLGQIGSYAAARDLYGQVLEAQEQVLGAEDLRTLNTRDYLARWTGEAGDPAVARDLLAELLPIDERVRGAEDPDTLTTRASLARWTGEAGDPAVARDLLAELLPVRERVRGAQHPHTVTTRVNLARWTGEAGDPAAARDLYAELLPVRERVLGAQHPDTLTTRLNLAYWTGEAGDPAAARDLLAELLPVYERVLGAQHPHTLTARANLAHWTEQAERS